MTSELIPSLTKSFSLKGKAPRYPIVQGGMGIGISLYELACAVSLAGAVGTVSSVALDQLTPARLGMTDLMHPIEATAREIADTKKDGGFASLNIMCAVTGRDGKAYEHAVRGAVEGGVDMIISGAGLPAQLPSITKAAAGKDHDVALVPIISSAKALKLLISRYWDKQGYRPDAIVLEGPKAGGHLGWSYKAIEAAQGNFLEEYDLFEKLLDPVLEIAEQFPNDAGPIPVIVAGGIFDRADIHKAFKRGASAVQMGTRFAMTHESGASEEYKKAIAESKTEDIAIGTADWGSPCGYPFRYLKTSPLGASKGQFKGSFCICAGLFATIGGEVSEGKPRGCPEGYVKPPGAACPAVGNTLYEGLFTCGTVADRIDRVISVAELMEELTGVACPAVPTRA